MKKVVPLKYIQKDLLPPLWPLIDKTKLHKEDITFQCQEPNRAR
jgi:hypothetical protein